MTKEQSGPRGFQLMDDPREGEPGASAISFGTLVLSLHTSALVHLGAAPLPGHEAPGEPNLPLAQQTIEILSMLERKTRGNLDPDEQHLMEGVLHELRLRYVEVKRARA